MRKFFLLFGLLAFSLSIGIISFGQSDGINENSSLAVPTPAPSPPTFKPEEGYVPDAETAIAIAVAVWNPIYGKERIASEKPYRAMLDKGVWTVRGSLPRGRKGGVAEVDISKDDGKILRLFHGK